MAWFSAAPLAAVAKAKMLEVEVNGEALLLFDLDGKIFATSAICPHHHAFLSMGSLEGDCLNCPRHFGQFHIPTGALRRGPESPDLRTFQVKVEDGMVFVAD